ncbi:MAG: DNA polymerase III subunit gamma/tau [Gemmatimonadaceae bacterium]|nr:DNA polymerase III subunit gamma/tau [Chitinophagaceae bacterium]
MDKFIVSARKYRPQNFSTVVGQNHITTTLKNAIKNNQLAHAFLFCGPRGVGKTTCARILAKTINCEERAPDGEACNTCHSCVSFNEGTSMNIHELDAASNNSVDDIRSLVEQVRFAPQAGEYKVYIIDEVHMLSSSAFNAFLKTLEEPPPYAIFILATTEKHKILPTILSRCQIFDFKRITLNDTVEHLDEICSKEEVKADKAALQIIAQKSEGCMRDALSILDKIVSFTNGEVNYSNTLEHLNILDADYYFKMLDCMQQQDLPAAMLLFDDINAKGFEGDMVIDGFAEFLRNLLVSKDEKASRLLEVVESFRKKYMEAAAKTSLAYIVSALNILNEVSLNYKSARNKRLHVELALIKLTYLQQALQLTQTETGAVKKKLLDTVKPLSFKKLVPVAMNEIPAGKVPEKQAKLIIEMAEDNADPAIKPAAVRPAAVRPVAQPAETTVQPQVETLPRMKIGALGKIREKYTGANGATTIAEIKPLTAESLKFAWDEYSLLLRKAKNPALQSFDLAELRVKDESCFEIATPNNLQLKFIEQERNNLSEFLQKHFNNRTLTFSIFIDENAEMPVQQDIPLSTKEQYQLLVQKYPLVKELKERLRLDLDY